METEVPSSPARPGAVASDLVEVTAAAAVMTVSTLLDSARDKELVSTGAYADTNPGVLDAADTRAALTAPVTLDLSGAELFGSARAERMVDS